MTTLLPILSNVHLPLPKWAADSSRNVLNFETKEKRQPPEMSHVREQLLK